STEALARARAVGVPHLIVRALHVRQFVLADGDPGDRLHLAEEAVRLAVDGDDAEVAVALHDRLLVLCELGRRAEVDRALDVLGGLARRTRAPIPWLVTATEAAVALSRGVMDQAEAKITDAWE